MDTTSSQSGLLGPSSMVDKFQGLLVSFQLQEKSSQKGFHVVLPGGCDG